VGVAEEYCYTPINYMAGMGTAPVEVSIFDGRTVDHLDWQTHGFQLLEHSSSVNDWDNPSDVEAHYYPEITELAKKLSGADHALITGHIARNPAQAELHADYAPIQFVHSDFSDDYGQRLIDMYKQGTPETARALAAAGIDAQEMARASRILILQFWRNVGPQAMDLPIAFADAQTVPRADTHPVHVPSYAGGDFAFDTLGVTPPPSGASHHWYVFPRMEVHEVVAFRTFDSRMAAQGEPYWTPHSAFSDPNVGHDAPARRSVEARATCLFY